MKYESINDGSELSYFNIDWLSENDGPGKRLVLFLQGCHLECIWCHSPHSQPNESPLLYLDSLCKKCQRCKLVCLRDVHHFTESKHTIKRDNCIKCGACIEACPQSSSNCKIGALSLPTRRADVLTLFKSIKPHLELLRNIGGITFSGGEPLLQSKALALLAKECKESGFHTALETSGIVPLPYIQNIFPYIDTWLVGMRLLTGANTLPSINLEKITRGTLNFLTQKPETEIIVRIPVIPGFTTTKSYLNSTKKILQEYKIKNIELLAHNPESSHYYKAIGLPNQIEYNSSKADKNYNYVIDFLLHKKPKQVMP